jgi:hypothetical protein
MFLQLPLQLARLYRQVVELNLRIIVLIADRVASWIHEHLTHRLGDLRFPPKLLFRQPTHASHRQMPKVLSLPLSAPPSSLINLLIAAQLSEGLRVVFLVVRVKESHTLARRS